MTVGELIERLLTFDLTLPVVCGPNGYDCEDATEPNPTREMEVKVAWPNVLPEAVVL